MTIQQSNDQGQFKNDPCEQLSELLPAYSIGATNLAETALVESLLAECPDVAEELHEYMGLSAALLEQVDTIKPPAHLHNKLMSAIQMDSVSEAGATPSIDTDKVVPFPMWRITIAVGLVAVMLLALTNIYWIVRFNDQRNQHNQEIANIQNEFTSFVALISENTQQVQLANTGDPETVFATVYWNPDHETALLHTVNLPPLTRDLIYQLWLIDDTGTSIISVGVFAVDDNGHGTLVFNPPQSIGEFSLLGITSEPEGGSEQPSTDPIAIGNI